MGNTWLYGFYNGGAYWEYAGEGLSIRCIEEEGMNTWQDEKHRLRFDYFDQLNLIS